MPLISVTRLRLRSVWYIPGFFWHSIKSFKQIEKAKGKMAARVFNDAKLTFWTCSIWEDKDHMLNYIKTGDHKKAMPHLRKWCSEARTAHIIIDNSEFPAAMEMKNILLQHGRASKLDHPNENHLKETIWDPKFKV